MALPKVVIVGRPNVGKSSLFNWLAGRRIAIVDDMAGVTRDRVGTLVQLGDDVEPRFFELIDTGGIGMVDRDDLSEDVERQIDTAMNEADLILFVVDIRDGLMPLDEEVAQRLRYLKTPVILVMNKADHPDFDNRGGEFYKLGRGKPIAVSAQQNRNKKQLLQADRGDAAAGRRRTAGRRRDEGRRRRPAQHRQVHVDQHPGPGRADDRLGAAGHHPRLGRRPLRARRHAVPGHRHRRRQAQGQDPRRAWTSTRSTAPSGRSAGPTSCCCSSTPPRASAGSTSNWPTTSPSSTSPASS